MTASSWAQWYADSLAVGAAARVISGQPSYVPEDEADATAEIREQGLWPVGPAEGEKDAASGEEDVASGEEAAASGEGVVCCRTGATWRPTP